MLVLPVQYYPQDLLTAIAFLGIFQNNYIFYYNYIGMPYAILPNFKLIFIFISFVIETFNKILMHCFAMGGIIVYHTIIISNTPNNISDYMKLSVIKS